MNALDNNRKTDPTGPKSRSYAVAFMIDHPCTSMLIIIGFIAFFVLSIVIKYIQKETLTVPDTVAMMGMSKRYLQEGQYDKAIEITKNLETRKSSYWYSEMTTGNAFFKKGQYAEAEKHFLKAAELNSSVPLPLLNLGLTYFRQGKPEEARACYKKVIDEFGTAYPDVKVRALDALELIEQTTGVSTGGSY